MEEESTEVGGDSAVATTLGNGSALPAASLCVLTQVELSLGQDTGAAAVNIRPASRSVLAVSTEPSWLLHRGHADTAVCKPDSNWSHKVPYVRRYESAMYCTMETNLRPRDYTCDLGRARSIQS